jgi:hypothetical protein
MGPQQIGGIAMRAEVGRTGARYSRGREEVRREEFVISPILIRTPGLDSGE